MLKSYELKNKNTRVKVIDTINIGTERANKQECDLSIAEYFLECLIIFDLKKTTHGNKMDV